MLQNRYLLKIGSDADSPQPPRFSAKARIYGFLLTTLVLAGLLAVWDDSKLGVKAKGLGRQEAVAAGRVAHLQRWEWLETSGGLSGVGRFARFVQIVVDDAHLRVADLASPLFGFDGKQLFLDDLADLMVSDEFLAVKRLVMVTEPSQLGQALVETTSDLQSFQPDLRGGNGRFRHFSLSAAAAYRFPGFLVDWFAEIVGKDTEVRGGFSPDSLADRKTNVIGRAFATFVRSRSLDTLADGIAVEAWIVKRFAPI
jgi:hypothetical protein